MYRTTGYRNNVDDYLRLEITKEILGVTTGQRLIEKLFFSLLYFVIPLFIPFMLANDIYIYLYISMEG